MILEYIKNWQFWTFIIAIASLLYSMANHIVGKIVASKIQNNELKHLKLDIDNIRKEELMFKKDLKKELHGIKLIVRRVERKQIKRDAICEEHLHRYYSGKGKKKE